MIGILHRPVPQEQAKDRLVEGAVCRHKAFYHTSVGIVLALRAGPKSAILYGALHPKTAALTQGEPE